LLNDKEKEEKIRIYRAGTTLEFKTGINKKVQILSISLFVPLDIKVPEEKLLQSTIEEHVLDTSAGKQLS
jgi:hypothetical protein